VVLSEEDLVVTDADLSYEKKPNINAFETAKEFPNECDGQEAQMSVGILK